MLIGARALCKTQTWKNTWSSTLEEFPSLLSGLSLNLLREHSAQFMTVYRFKICFSFPFLLLSTFHIWPRVHAAEEEGENAGLNLLCSTVLCHFLPTWQSQAVWRAEIPFPRNQHVWALWIQEDEHQQINQSIFGLHLFSSLLEKTQFSNTVQCSSDVLE